MCDVPCIAFPRRASLQGSPRPSHPAGSTTEDSQAAHGGAQAHTTWPENVAYMSGLMFQSLSFWSMSIRSSTLQWQSGTEAQHMRSATARLQPRHSQTHRQVRCSPVAIVIFGSVAQSISLQRPVQLRRDR